MSASSFKSREELRSCPTEFCRCLPIVRSEVITKWVFTNWLQPAVDFHTLPSRTSLKAFLLTLTYNFIIRFGLSSSPTSLSWYMWFRLVQLNTSKTWLTGWQTRRGNFPCAAGDFISGNAIKLHSLAVELRSGGYLYKSFTALLNFIIHLRFQAVTAVLLRIHFCCVTLCPWVHGTLRRLEGMLCVRNVWNH